MCGLAGKAVIGHRKLPGIDEIRLRAMSNAVAHRGPDGENIVIDGPVGFAFRRLALVAADAGEQPVSDPAHTVILMANGEVYNHRELEASFPGRRFTTRSDCEVLAHLYARDGLRFLDRVLGMFAIVLYDRRRNSIVLARDRFGIKPLYLAHCGDAVLFSSEIKALFQDPACPRELDWRSALADQAVHGAPLFTFRPLNSWFRGIEAVPAGTIVTIDLTTGSVDRRSYWKLPHFGGDNPASAEEIISEYRDLLASSVADCVAADAEVGLFLSGGVDSSAVAALAAGIRRLHTFTVLNGSTLANGDAEAAHKAASSLGLPNHQLAFETGRFPDAEQWKRLLWLLETPQCGPEQYYKYELYRYVKQLRPQIKGMLLGQASDEFNGGYSVQLSGGTSWDGFQQNLLEMSRSAAIQNSTAFGPWQSYHDSIVVSDEVLRDISEWPLDDPYNAFIEWKYRDIQQYNCWHEDRTAAGNGIEARVPFLDHRVVELMASIPACRRSRLLWDKSVLRAAVRELLPPEIVYRPKVSFYHGSGEEYTHRTFVRMMSADKNALVEEALSAPGACEFLRADVVRSMLRRLQESAAPTGSEFLLRLVNLGLLDRMARDLPPPPVKTPAYPLAPAADVTKWDQGLMTARILRIPGPSPTDVVRAAEGTLILGTPSDSTILYLAVNGRIEYVVDAGEEPLWAAFLRNIDGKRTLGQILEAAGAHLSGIASLLAESIDAGLLTTQTPPLTAEAVESSLLERVDR
jgi:asparagine synthase (glutamine-hydrolysing)